MHHIAILRRARIQKGDNLFQDILDGRKTIESRWYVNKVAPWNRIKEGEIVYFKESGKPVCARARVSKVIQYENLTPKTILEIITKYGREIAPNTSSEEFIKWSKTLKKKRYVILVFFEKVKKIKPFDLDKTGFGISSAWLCVEDINTIKI